MNYVEVLYQKDRRYKEGERVISRRVVDEATMKFCQEAKDRNPNDKWRLEYYPEKKLVTNLMSGKTIEIDTDTPRCCDPSSELYWSM